MARIFAAIGMVLAVFLAGCNGNDDSGAVTEEAIDGSAMLDRAADLMQTADTFSLEVLPEGAPFSFTIDLGSGTQSVRFIRAIAHFAPPSEVQADVNVQAGGQLEITIYANGPEQWFRAPLIGWVNQDFAEGFDPSRIIREGGGFEAAVGAVRDLIYEGRESINGIGTYHFSGNADGAGLTDLLVGLIEIPGIVPVSVFIDHDTGYPVRLVIRQPLVPESTAEAPNTEEMTDENTTTWVVDVYDVNRPDELVRPEGVGATATQAALATAEGVEATPEGGN